MRRFLGLALAAALLAGAARAEDADDEVEQVKLPPTITCPSYKTRFEQVVAEEHILSKPTYVARKFTPTNVLVDYPFVQAVIGCDAAGMFTGFGATLHHAEQPFLWRTLLQTAIRAFDPTLSRAAAQAELDALIGAAQAGMARNRATGDRTAGGSEEVTRGNYVLYYSVSLGNPNFQIELRYRE